MRRSWRDWAVVLIACLGASPALAQTAEPAPAEAPAATEPAPPPPPAPVPAPPPPAPAPVAPKPAAPQGVLRKDTGVLHGLGFAASFTYGSGFSYRHYFGESALQFSGFGWAADRGDNALLFGGVAFSHYLFMWHGANRTLASTSALRLVAAGTWFHYRSTPTSFDVAAPCDPTFNTGCTTTRAATTAAKQDTTDLLGLGAGVGFEFGAIMQPGFSVSLDLLLTAAFDHVGVPVFMYPLPAGSLIYSW